MCALEQEGNKGLRLKISFAPKLQTVKLQTEAEALFMTQLVFGPVQSDISAKNAR